MNAKLTFNPRIFNVNDIPQAMRIILTPEDSTTEQRWRTETPHVADLIQRNIRLTADSVVLDYGCGIGRIGKELIARTGCRVIGVDISPSMRALSVIYVQSDRFLSCSAEMLDAMLDRGFRFDAAVSIWVLQHCFDPRAEVTRIRRALAPHGQVFILNTITRCVPTMEAGFVNDHVDIKGLMAAEFSPQDEGRLDRDKTTEAIMNTTYWAAFRQRTAADAAAAT